VLEWRGHGHDVLCAFVVGTDFEDPAQRIRRKGAQPRQERLVLRRLSARQKVHGDVAPEAAPPGAKAFWTFPRQRFNQLVLLRDVHVRSAFI
jgi:hypothetical protein